MSITKLYALEIGIKKTSFQHFSETRNTLFATLITFGGLIPNEYSATAFANHIEVGELFG